MITRGQQTPIFHRYVRHKDTLYVSGLIANELSLPMGGQTKQIADRLNNILEEAGSDARQVLQSTVYITDLVPD